MGAFSAKFSTTLSGKTIDGTQKSLGGVKWWNGPPLSSCNIWWKSRDARRRERMKCDVFHFFYFFLYYRHCFYSRADFWVFCPAGATLCTDQSEIWRERMKCDVFHFFIFLKITLVGRRPLWCVVELLPKDIASVFVVVGRFRWCLQRSAWRVPLNQISQKWGFTSMYSFMGHCCNFEFNTIVNWQPV